jgi:hypothetical protein
MERRYIRVVCLSYFPGISTPTINLNTYMNTCISTVIWYGWGGTVEKIFEGLGV